jgi:hypothetical protein
MKNLEENNMKNPFDQLNDPLIREAIRQQQELQRNPAYQSHLRELEMRRKNPLHDQALRGMERLHKDPHYKAMRQEIERQRRDPAYRALLDSLKDERRHNYLNVFSESPDTSQMQDLLKVSVALKANEFDNFRSGFRMEQIQILIDAKKLQDSDGMLRTFEELRRGQKFYDSYIKPENLLRQELIHFKPPAENPLTEKIEPSEKQQISAEMFLLDLQVKYEEIYNELADNEQLDLFAAFNGFTIKVISCVADTFNRIRLNGMLGDNETVVFVKQSDFNILFVKEVVEPQKTKRKIGFILESEIDDEEDS